MRLPKATGKERARSASSDRALSGVRCPEGLTAAALTGVCARGEADQQNLEKLNSRQNNVKLGGERPNTRPQRRIRRIHTVRGEKGAGGGSERRHPKSEAAAAVAPELFRGPAKAQRAAGVVDRLKVSDPVKYALLISSAKNGL